MRSRQVDFVSTYTQAPLDTDVYMNMPIGFIIEDGSLIFTDKPTAGNISVYILRLDKNLYCLHQAGSNWFDTLRTSLLTYGFHQSLVDPCLFLCHNIVLVLYVDDCLLFTKNPAILDTFLPQLGCHFVSTSGPDVGAFLGIEIQRTSESHLLLTQPGLIHKIVEACSLETESKHDDTPAETKILRNEKDVVS